MLAMQCKSGTIFVINIGTMYKVRMCNVCPGQLSAKMLFIDKSNKIYSVMTYGEVVRDLAGASDETEVTEECLMELPQLSSLTYNEKHIKSSQSDLK